MSAGRLINELSRAAHVYFQAEFKKYSIGHAQIRTLLYIAHNNGLTQMELANYLNLDKSSITSQIQILEGNGYIRRHTSDKDARIQKISITENTRELLPSLQMIFSSWTEALLNGFSESERIEIFKYLERMHNNSINKLDQKKSINKK